MVVKTSAAYRRLNKRIIDLYGRKVRFDERASARLKQLYSGMASGEEPDDEIILLLLLSQQRGSVLFGDLVELADNLLSNVRGDRQAAVRAIETGDFSTVPFPDEPVPMDRDTAGYGAAVADVARHRLGEIRDGAAPAGEFEELMLEIILVWPQASREKLKFALDELSAMFAGDVSAALDCVRSGGITFPSLQ